MHAIAPMITVRRIFIRVESPRAYRTEVHASSNVRSGRSTFKALDSRCNGGRHTALETIESYCLRFVGVHFDFESCNEVVASKKAELIPIPHLDFDVRVLHCARQFQAEFAPVVYFVIPQQQQAVANVPAW